MVNVKRNIIGKKFGRLLVLKRAEDHIKPNGARVAMVECLCDCGNIIITTQYGLLLKNGRATKSCGCLQKEKIREIGFKSKQYNKYDLTGEYGIGYTNKGEEFYFDLEDYDKIKDYCWYSTTDQQYLKARNPLTNKLIKFHHLILPIKEGYDIDHINGNRIDNRKENLRYLTRQQNTINKHKCNSSSGIIGVYWDKNRNKWKSQCKINNHVYNIGRYDTLEEAIYQRVKFERDNIEHDIAPNRDLFIQYNFINKT